MAVQVPADGDRLHELVATYSTFGDHRTGSAVDARTAAWVGDQLGTRGLEVAAVDVPYDHHRISSNLTVDGDPIPHLVVPYEFPGSIETTAVHTATMDPGTGGRPGALDAPIAAARAAGAEAAVFATAHPEGSLVAINRELGAPTSGFPTVLVAGRDGPRSAAGSVRVAIDSEIGPGTTTNLVAGNGVDGPPLLLTTPLTGWFGCAGERGTGIAVLLHLVEALADLPLLVVATGGHELGWFGAHRWVEDFDGRAAGVVHVGASVAVVEPGTGPARPLAPTRVAMTSLTSVDARAVATALAPAELDLRSDSDSWMGEAQAFCRLGIPLLSVTGAGRDFHCPEDTPDRATTPRALAIVADAFTDAARALYTEATR